MSTEAADLRCQVGCLLQELRIKERLLVAERARGDRYYNQLHASDAHNYHITTELRRVTGELRQARRPQPPPPASPPPASPPPSPSYTPTSRSYSPQSDSQCRPSPSHTPVTPPYTPSDPPATPPYTPSAPPEDGPSSTDDDDDCKEIHRPPRHIETVSLSNSGSETDEVACTPGQERRPATVPASMPALEPDAPVTPPRRSNRTAARRLDFANLPVSDFFPASPEPANKRQRRE